MATINAVKSTHATLTGATADTVNLQQPWDRIEVLNRDAAATLYFTVDGTVAVAAAAGTEVVLPGQAAMIRNLKSTVSPYHSLSVVGTSNPYSVTGIAGA